MKKRVNPELLRHILFPVHMNFNDIIKKKDAQSLIFFQDTEIKQNLPRFFALFDIMCLDCQIIRSAFSLNVYLTYYHKENIKDIKKKFLTKGLSRLNFTKLQIIHSWFALIEDSRLINKIKIFTKKYTKNLTYIKFKKKNKLKLALFNTKYEKLESLRRDLSSKYSTLSKYYQIKLQEKKAQLNLKVFKPVFNFQIPKQEVIVNTQPQHRFNSKYQPQYQYQPQHRFNSKFQPKFSTKRKTKKSISQDVFNPLLAYLPKILRVKYLELSKKFHFEKIKKKKMEILKTRAKIRKILGIKEPSKRKKKSYIKVVSPFLLPKKNEKENNIIIKQDLNVKKINPKK